MLRKEVLMKEDSRRSELLKRLREATSSAFVEKQAREKLGLAKEGDTIILLDKSQLTNSNNQFKQNEPKSNWERWWKLFF